jgi:prophage antirepressor-like protein
MMNLIPMQFHDYEVHMFFDDEGTPWWPAQGPCAALGLDNVGMAVARLPEHHKRIITVDTNRGPRAIWAINESGLYRLMMTSRKPQAEAFRLWITDEVLPQIRKTGRYEFTDARYLRNIERANQVDHARHVAVYQSALGGKGARMDWFRKSLKGITGMEPKQWCETGKQHNLPHRVYRRGREVVRVLQPAGARPSPSAGRARRCFNAFSTRA